MHLFHPLHTQSYTLQPSMDSSGGLQRQQLLGLEALLLAGVCHRQSVEDLLASDAMSPEGFEWGRQVRMGGKEGELQFREGFEWGRQVRDGFGFG
jgi:hypothetical protein